MENRPKGSFAVWLRSTEPDVRFDLLLTLVALVCLVVLAKECIAQHRAYEEALRQGIWKTF